MPDRSCFLSYVGDERRQIRRKFVAPPLAELLEEITGPIGIINLEAIAEDRVGRVGVERLKQPVTNGAQVVLDSCRVVMIKDEAFGAHRRALDLHAGVARNEKEQLIGPLKICGKCDGAISEVCGTDRGVSSDGLTLHP